MKKIILLSAILLTTACAQNVGRDDVVIGEGVSFPGVARQQYVNGTEDLPVYYGFKESADSNISYDSIDGRIVDASFSSDAAQAGDVRKFYETVLPQLGWAKQEYQLYKREGELLRINIIKRDDEVLLKIAIRPSSL